MALPSWVTQDILEEAVAKFLNVSEPIKVLSVASKRAVSEGDNYTSNLYRVTVTIDHKQQSKISLIVKCQLDTTENRKKLMDEINVFGKEICMYTEIMPKLDNLLRTDFSPRCLYARAPVNYEGAVLIFEDLCEQHFRMANRHMGLDREHSLKVVQRLAEMHAASVVVHNEHPNLMKLMDHGIFIDKPEMRQWVLSSVQQFIDTCEHQPKFETYAYRLKELGMDTILKRCFDTNNKRMGSFHALNHGDLWLNNMMFLYNDQDQVIDVKFVDLQLGFYSSPCIDLHYFIVTSLMTTDSKEFEHTVETLLRFYHAHLTANLLRLQVNEKRIPSQSELYADFQERAFFGLMVAMSVLPIIKADSRQDANLDGILSDEKSPDSFRHHAYNNPRFLNHILMLLEYYEPMGIMD